MSIRRDDDGSLAMHLTVPAGLDNPFDLDELDDWLEAILVALGGLRSGEFDEPGASTVDQLYGLISTLNRMNPRMEGIQHAMLRAYAHAGGSYQALGRALDTGTELARSRAEFVLADDKSVWERWATGELPT